MASVGLDLLKFIVALVLRATLDLICLLLSPLFFVYYRYIVTRSMPSGGKKQFSSILITGASSGMGKSTALHFAKQVQSRPEGSEMILHLTGRNTERLKSVKQECLELAAAGKAGGELKCYTHAVDISNQKGMESVVLGADDMKPLDLIFANAGKNFSVCSTFEFKQSTRELVDTNINGTLNTIFPILPRFMSRRAGHIAVNASLASYTNRTDCASYAATKVYLRFVTEAMHWGLHNFYDIGVSVVNPGYVQTAMFHATSGAAIEESVRPGQLTSTEAAKIIVEGLERNEYSIDFPFSLWSLVWLLGSLHPIIRVCLGKLLVHKRMIDNVFPDPKQSEK